MECLSGILFLGTPHSSTSDKDTLLRHNQILYSCAKVAAQKGEARLSRADIRKLANLAATFEQIATIPILSVFEGDAPTSMTQKFFSKRSKVSGHNCIERFPLLTVTTSHKSLVNRDLAKITLQAEKLLGVQLAHSELCKLPQLTDSSYSARDFLRSLLISFSSE